MSTPESLISKEDVALAAGVTVRAVSNWARRHPDFPQAVGRGSRARYPASALAAWLDGHKIPRPVLRSGESHGRTYGARFRAAVGLPPSLGASESADVPSADLLDEQLWTPLERLLRNSEAAVFEAVVLSLLCLQDSDPVGWAAISRATADRVREVVMQVWQRQPEHMAKATASLRDVLVTPWWRHQLVRLVDVLSADRTPAAHAFEYLLDRFAKHRHSSSDEYLMPGELARLMVRMLDPGPSSRVHDPCCGLGSLLVAAGEHMSAAAESGSPVTVTGRAATARTWSLATMNIAIHGMQYGLGGGPPADPGEVDADLGRYDVVLLNPPFGMRKWSVPPSRSQRPWPYGEPSPHNIAFAWLQTAVEALAPGGRAAVVMPHSATYGRTRREHDIRAEMVERGAVRCVIALPGYLFRETTVPVTVWILVRPGDDASPDVLLIDARAAAHSDGRTHRVLTERGCQAIVDAYQVWLNGSASFPRSVDDVTATTASAAEIRAHGYDLQPATYLNQRRRAKAEQRSREQLWTLSNELTRLDAAARAADLALDRCLEGLAPWIP